MNEFFQKVLKIGSVLSMWTLNAIPKTAYDKQISVDFHIIK